MDRVTGILLAAGSSRRFGADKQSTLVGGVPMLTRAARLLLDAGFVMPIVVLGPRASEHRPLLAGLPLQVVENPAAESGMASSLVAALKLAGGSDAIVITVCDQPAVTADHLRSLVAAWRATGSSIVATSYAGTQGVPTLFAATHFPELRQLGGDRGAGPLLARHPEAVHPIPLPGGELDIDTPADLTRLPPPRGASRNSSPRNQTLLTLNAMRDESLTVTAVPGKGEGVTVLLLKGPLLLRNTFDFQQDLAQHKPAVLIIDLTESPYMDSAGLGLLMNYYVSAEKSGRKLLLAGANERITALLEMTKVHLILKNYPTAADAEASVRA